ncbi:MAG: cyclic nucleotide-binding domain-containing protein, partial [Bacteroidota bacterium]
MTLQQYLQSLIPMPTEKADLIAEHLKNTTFHKQEIFLREGQISRYSYFLEEGFIRCFTVDLEGNEVTTRIFSAPDFISDYLSFFKQQPSKENYEALTPCKIKTLDFESAQYCFHNILEIQE